MTLLQTKLSPWHREHGAVMTCVSGWEMPLHYQPGVTAEHLHTRQKAGLFDFSHMGKVLISGPQATAALSALATANLNTLQPGRCRYSFFLNENGGIKDDLIIYRLEQEKYLLVTNPSTRTRDVKDLKTALPESVACSDISLSAAKFDLQGPLAFSVLDAVLQGAWKRLPYYGFIQTTFEGSPLLVSRTGYTGELGVELYCPVEHAQSLWATIVAHKDVIPVGVGARDTLRLEVGLPVYGVDLDENHTPAEAGFAGLLNSQAAYTGKEHAHTIREKLTALTLEGNQPANAGDAVHTQKGTVAGKITSSIMAPSLNCIIALAYMGNEENEHSSYNVQTLNGPVTAKRASLPFYTGGTARNPLV